MGNQYLKLGYIGRLARVKKNIEEHAPELEYVKGFTGSEGRIIVRYKECGHEMPISLPTIRHSGHRKHCPICSGEITEKELKNRYKQYEVEKHFKAARRTEQAYLKQCPVCGSFFFDFDDIQFCSEECRTKHRKHYRNHYKSVREKKCRTEDSKDITLEAVWKRDKGRCWLCKCYVDLTLDPNDELYGSIEHVIPLSRGGKDRWENVALAHRRCNRIKGNRADIRAIREEIFSDPLYYISY